ncbi:MAG: glycoside hydrolase family 16 protein [Sphingobium sp.]|uniref:glycoside hydrolase family 16 protein n=1 Tax=Sphingobium sp. TaxID=1912891 RepID=UPI002E21359B
MPAMRLVPAGLMAALLPLSGCIPAAQPGQSSAPPPASLAVPEGYRLTWSEEFDGGDSPDPAKWTYDTHRNRQGWYNGEAQYYARDRRRNIRVENGVLLIEAHRETLDRARHPDWGGQHYTSGRLVTRGRRSWTRGYFEVRAKMPCARGTWPAIWLLPVRESRRWQGGEIDMAEHVGAQPGIIHHSVQTPARNFRNGDHPTATTQVADACAAFHRYQLHWTDQWVRIGVDDRVALTVHPADLGVALDSPMYLILNLAIGGDWGGAKGIDDDALPARLEVDYVRVFEEGAA